MIDLSVILLIGVAILIFHMKEIGEHPDLESYLHFPGKAKVSTGTMSLLFHLLSGTFIFLPFYFTIHSGYLSGLVFSLEGAAMLFLFSKKITPMISTFSSYTSLQAYLQRKFTNRGLRIFNVVLFAAGAEGLLVSSLLASRFINRIFSISPYWTCAMLFFFCFIFAGMGGAGGVRRIGAWLQFLFYIGLAVLPFALIMIRGVNWTQRRFAHLPDFDADRAALIAAVIIFPILFAGQFLLYLLFHWDLLKMKKARLKTTMRLTAVCWSAMPIAASVICLYFVAATGKVNLLEMIAKVSLTMSHPLLYLFVLSVLACLTLSVGISLYRVTSLFITLFPKKMSVQKGYLVSFLFSLIVIFIPSALHIRVETALIVYVNLLLALCLPLLLLINSKVSWSSELSIIIICSVVAGDWYSLTRSLVQGAFITILISSMAVTVFFIRKIR